MATKKPLKESVESHAATAARLQADAEIARLRSERDAIKARYRAALAQIDAERARADAVVGLAGVKAAPPVAASKKSGKRHSATMVVLLSDVHCEEFVDAATVNRLNHYSLEICDERLAELQRRFFQMLEHERRLADITRVVIWLGGDFITGAIHPDCVEVSQLAPMPACRWIGSRLRRFIDAVADNAESVIVATNSGNHGRATEKQRVATEEANSYEHFLYELMASEERRKNVDWRVAQGHLNYVDLDGFVIRFCHGHAIRYSGGNYGVALPATKAIAAWDTFQRADLTCFGHYHSFGWLRAGRYVSNGSVIGHSAYAVKIKAPWEAPCQAGIVIDGKRREVTKAFPIYCDGDLARLRA